MLDFRLATFLKLCETRSYTKTAKFLGITQPSVTQHIKYLQKKYQCQLLIYEGKTLRLTPAGEYLRRQAEAMAKTANRVTADLRRMGEQATVLRFGFPAELGEERGAELTAGLMAAFPENGITLHIANMPELVSMTENGALDLVLTDKAFAAPSLLVHPAWKMHFGCYIAANAEQPANTKQLLTACLLLPEAPDGDRIAAETLLLKKNITPVDFASVWESNSRAALSSMTAAGNGICFAYAGVMDTERTALLALGDLADERTLVFLCRKDASHPEVCKAMAEHCRGIWQSPESAAV